MENKDRKKSLEAQYPAVGLAYEFVKPSYDWMLNRIEAMNSKIQGLLTLATAVTATMPILAKAMFDNLNFQSVWFLGAIATYLLLAIVGIYGLRKGEIKLIHPKVLYDKWLEDTLWEFRKDAIYFAGQHLDHNKKIVGAKSRSRDIMNWLLLGELSLIIIWIVLLP